MRSRAVRGAAGLVRDALPLIAIVVAWEGLRLFPDGLRGTVQSDSVIAIERAFFGGVPSVTLQAALRRPGEISLLDAVMAFVYLGHFVVAAAAAFLLWLRDREHYFHFALGLMVLSIAGFVTHALVPVAPPRFSGLYGEALPIVDVADVVYRGIGLDWLAWSYENLIGDPVAAFPSLHAAYPVLSYLSLRRRWPRGGLLMLGWGALVVFDIVYLGHHYVVDIVGGVVYALVAYVVVDRGPFRRIARWGAAVSKPAARQAGPALEPAPVPEA